MFKQDDAGKNFVTTKISCKKWYRGWAKRGGLDYKKKQEIAYDYILGGESHHQVLPTPTNVTQGALCTRHQARHGRYKT